MLSKFKLKHKRRPINKKKLPMITLHQTNLFVNRLLYIVITSEPMVLLYIVLDLDSSSETAICQTF